MARLHVWTLMIFLLFIINQQATCETFHIIPSANSPCPGRLTGEPCFTLSQYLSGEHRQYISDPQSEIVLEFQPGFYMVDRNFYTLNFASQLISFTMNAVNSTEIHCGNDRCLINNVQNVYINGISFRQCSYEIESVMNFTLVDSSFSEANNYDALYIQRSSATIKRCNFTNNAGVPLHVDNSLTEIHHTMFVNNNNGQYTYSNGGALAVENTQSMVNVNHCTFVDNINYYSGGAIVTSSSLFIQQSSFRNNLVRYGSGGAIYMVGTNILLFINQSEFMNNRIPSSQAGNGGAVYVHGDNISVSIQQSMIKNSTSRGDGGAVYVSGGSSSVSICQSVIDNNSVQTGSGAAVYLTGDNSRILIEQSSISNNEARRDSGGAIYTNGLSTYISITESTINKNSAVKCGALDISNFHHYNIKFKNSVFLKNSAITKSGGVMCIRNASISIQNVIFSHNRAAENGGVFAVDDSEVIIHGSTFDSNTAGANGGVLNSEYFRTSLFISHASFTNNQGAKQGGVMYLGRKGSQIKISRSEISSNNAMKGGFATILGSSLEIAMTDIFNNTAETGEVVSACNSDISVSDELFSAADPVHSVCTLISGDANDTTELEVTTTTSTEVLTNTTTITDIPVTTSRPTPETTTMNMSATTTTQPTESSIIFSVHFVLNGKMYPNNSVISLTDVGENEHALLCKTDLMTCCATPPNRFGEFYYPYGDTIPVKKAGHGFYRNRGAQEVRLNRREGVTSPSGKFRCAVPDASGTIQNLFIYLHAQ